MISAIVGSKGQQDLKAKKAVLMKRFSPRSVCVAPVLVALVCLAVLSGCLSTGAADEHDLTFVIFPDAQLMVQLDAQLSDPHSMWKSVCRWVIDNCRAQNIRAVLGVGDVTNRGTPEEFQAASAGFAAVETAGVPSVPIGNHDCEPGGGYDSRTRRTANFDAVFGANRFDGKPWYGGNLNGSNANYYIDLNVDGSRFLLSALEVCPRPEAVAWALGVIDAHPDSLVIVLTHAYLKVGGARIGKWDASGPMVFGNDGDATGQDLWDQLIKRRSNILAVIRGHVEYSPYTAHSLGLGYDPASPTYALPCPAAGRSSAERKDATVPQR